MILLTGGTGFLGRVILKMLLDRGENVRALVRDPGKMHPRGGLELAEGDVLDICSLEKAYEGVDRVIHAAAVVSFWKRRRAEMTRINVEGTANMVNMALDAGVDKFVHVSSIAALGRIYNAPVINEETRWVKSRLNSAYGRSKYLAELEVQRGVQEGLRAVICNPGVIVGPGDWQTGSPRLFSTIYQGLRFSNSGQSGFVSVDDVSRATIALLDSEFSKGERFVLVSDNLEYKQIFGMIAQSLKVRAPQIVPPAFVTRAAGKMSEILGNIRNKEPLITPETMRSSRQKFAYDGQKITRLTSFRYSSLEEAIRDTGRQFLREHGNTGPR